MTRRMVEATLPEHVGPYRLVRLTKGRGYAIWNTEARRPAYTEGRRTAVIGTRSEARRILEDLFEH